MTAKEKAIELVEKYVDIQKELDETTTFYWGFAQKCANNSFDANKINKIGLFDNI